MSSERRLRVALICTLFPPFYTGAGRQALAVAGRLSDRVDTEVLTLGDGRLPETWEGPGLVVRRFGSLHEPGDRRAFARRLFQHLIGTRPRPDVIHILSVGLHAYAALTAARMIGLPAIVKLTLEGEDDPVSVSRKRLGGIWLRLLRQARALVCPSKRLRELAQEAGVPEDRLESIPNGVDLNRFSPAPDRDPKHIAIVGGIIRRKGVHRVVEAMPDVLSRHPDARLSLVGPGPQLQQGMEDDAAYYERLRRLVQEPPLRDAVRLEGLIERPENVLNRCGVFTLPTEAEGHPNALLEGMAAGLAPVASDLPAIREIVEPGRNGVLVSDTSPAAWAEALIALLDNPGTIRDLGAEARKTVEKRFSLDAAATRIFDLYHELAGS